MFLFVDLK